MNNQMLVMKYHPAKKEIQFRRFQNGQEAIIREDSRLMHYMNDKGTFILQNQGDSFFEDIAAAFDGLKEVNMQIVTTKLDYPTFTFSNKTRTKQQIDGILRKVGIKSTNLNAKLTRERRENVFSDCSK